MSQRGVLAKYLLGAWGGFGARRPTWQRMTIWSLNKEMWEGKTAQSSSNANVVRRSVTFTRDLFTI